MASSQHRCVFVGNIPYDATEEQLIEICQEVGPVVSFRLVIDRETGKPKGYGFCEYKDEETALSARRNLQGYEINGRQLRVDFAENDKGADRNREQGRGGPGLVANVDTQKQIGGRASLVESSQHQPIGLHIAITAAAVMAGALAGAQSSMQSNQNGLQSASMVNDPLTLHLAKLSRSQLREVMSELKMLATQNKELARQLLIGRPQLLKSLFQAQIMLGMVTPEVLQMPNLRQASGQTLQPLLHESQQNQPSAFQTLTGLPPLAPNKMQSVLPQNPLANKQFSTPQESPMTPRVDLQQHGQGRIPQQGNFPGQSGVTVQPSGSLSMRPQIQVSNSPFLNKQVQPPMRDLGQAGGPIYGQNIRAVNQSMTSQHSLLSRPLLPSAVYQPGPSISSGTSQTISKDIDSSAELSDTMAHRGNMYLKMPLGTGKASIHDPSVSVNRPPSKLMRLDDGRTPSFSTGGSNVSNTNGIGSIVVSSDSKADERQFSQKQVSQIPSDVESALLQQVLNLTPEQLSLLPFDQQQQVIQLQQALRRDQIQPS